MVLVALATMVTSVPGCSRSDNSPEVVANQIPGLDTLPPTSTDVSWKPRPVRRNGLTTLATARDGAFALETYHGSESFLAGVNVGSTTPGHQPGELAITADSIGAGSRP